MSVQNKIQVGFVVSLLFLLLTGGAAWWSAHRNVETFRAVDHTYQVLHQVEVTLVEMLNAETRSRGFVISGDEAALKQYRDGIQAVQKSFATAKQLTQDNPGQQQRLASLAPLIQQKISLADEAIRLARAGERPRALKFIASGEGTRTMDEIRRVIGEIEQEEDRLLALRAEKAQAMSRATIGVVFFSTCLALALVGTASVMVRRDFERRRLAEDERDRFFMLSVDMLAIASGDGYFKRVNPAFTNSLGWSTEEMLVRPFIEFVHPEDRSATMDEVEKQVLRGEKVLHFVNRYQHKDGSWRWLSWTSAPQAGGLLYATARDITEVRQAQEALRRSEESLAVTLNSIGDAVLATDINGRISRMNPVAEKLTGWAQADALARPVAEVFNILKEESREPAVIPVDKVLATGEIHGLANHTLLISRDGTERPIGDSAAPIRDRDGRTLGVVLVFRDMSAERQAEQRLEQLVQQRTAEMRQALATLDVTDDGAFIFEPETLRYTYVNEGAVRQLGYTREELLQMTPVDYKPEFTEARYRELLAPMQRGEARTHRFTALHRHKDGHQFPVEINLQYVSPAGGRPRFIAVVRDISERQKHERMALRSQRLEAIGTLAGGVAHDLNNALAPILMGVEILKMQYPEESKIIDMFESSAKRGADMVRQLLAFAKGAEGERISIQPSRLFKEMQNLIKGSFPKNIQLVSKCDANLPAIVGDATQLHQILLNLCVNARDAMPQGGTLTLDARTAEVDAAFAISIPDAKPGSYAVLRVRDTGMGIPPDILDRIFEPFFTTKGPDKGTGLGLSTVMGIVKGHGGFLQVYSQVGQGSTFAVYLPANRAGKDTERVIKPALDFRGQGETILLVDDEAAVREMGRAVLRRLNFTPLTATDGADGLVQAAEHRTELHAIITDLHMPHMDGLAFTRAVRRVLPEIPVLVTSGRLEEAIAEEFKSLKVTSRLDKPFTEASLAEALKQVLPVRL